MRALFLAVVAAMLSACASAYASPPEQLAQLSLSADMAYFDGGACPVLGADAGVNLTMQVTPGDQFMVSYSTFSGVTYRLCKTSSCLATANDAPIAANAQVDLCGRSGYPYLSFNKLYDGGNPPICVYDVIPGTVCPAP